MSITPADEDRFCMISDLNNALAPLSDKADRTPVVRTVTGNYTLTAADVVADVVLNVNSATDVTVTIPVALVVELEVEIRWRQYGAGAVTFVGAAGVTLLALNNFTKSAGRYSTGALRRVATNTFLLSGDIVTGGSNPVASVPDAPATATATGGVEQATVNWTAPASNGGSTLLGYTITWSAGGGGSVTATAAATSAQVTGLNGGTAYTFTVTARNSVGSGAGATTNSVTPTAGATPVTPTGNFYDVPAYTVPTNAVRYNGTGSLATAMSGLAAGRTLILDWNGTITQNVDVALRDGVQIYAAAGKRPVLNGLVRISGGESTRIWGLDVAYSTPAPDNHMVKLDGGSPDWGYSRMWLPLAGCYTLMRPGQLVHDWRVHHSWLHDNEGPHRTTQDHAFYCSADNLADQNGMIDHCLIENTPWGRGVKIGGSSQGPAIAGITVRKCTLRNNLGQANIQVSNGATRNHFEFNVLIDSGLSTNIATGSGTAPANTYANNRGDRTVGPNNSSLDDLGGNVTQAKATLLDYAAQGRLGFGHLSAT